MDPYIFLGTLLGILLAHEPVNAGVVCDRRGFCVEQPQFQQPYYPPPQIYISPPRYNQSPPPRDAAGAEVKNEILEFCTRHPEESFCGKLQLYLNQHPESR